MEEKVHSQHRRAFSLCICTHWCWALQWSNVVTTAAMGAKFKGAMDDASPRYACQTWLPCLSCLNVNLRLCLWQLMSTSSPDEIYTGATDPSCCDTSEGWHGHHPAAVTAWAAPASVFACATCHRSCATASSQHYTAPQTGLESPAGLKITFSFAKLFLTRISSLIQVTM